MSEELKEVNQQPISYVGKIQISCTCHIHPPHETIERKKIISINPKIYPLTEMLSDASD